MVPQQTPSPQCGPQSASQLHVVSEPEQQPSPQVVVGQSVEQLHASVIS